MLYPWQYQKEIGHLGIQRHFHLSQVDTQVMFHSKEDQKEKLHLRSVLIVNLIAVLFSLMSNDFFSLPCKFDLVQVKWTGMVRFIIKLLICIPMQYTTFYLEHIIITCNLVICKYAIPVL